MSDLQDIKKRFEKKSLNISDITAVEAYRLIEKECDSENPNYELIEFCMAKFIGDENRLFWYFSVRTKMLEKALSAETIQRSKQSNWLKRFILSKQIDGLLNFLSNLFKKGMLYKILAIIFCVVIVSNTSVGSAFIKNIHRAVNDITNKIYVYVSDIEDDRVSAPYDYFNKLPDNLSFSNYFGTERAFGYIYRSEYTTSEDDVIILEIKLYNNSNWITEVETNGDVEIKTINGNKYGYSQNYKYNVITWNKGNRSYVLTGTVSMELLEELIKMNER